MRENVKKDASHRMKVCLIAIAVSFAALLALAMFDKYNHQILKTPQIENCTISLAGGKNQTVLDGTWQFFWHRCIVSENYPNMTPDKTVSLPHMWIDEEINGERCPSAGYASYRMTVKEPPVGTKLTCYIPNLGGAYRVFMNGTLVSQSGTFSKYPPAVFSTTVAQMFPYNVASGVDIDLVIECASQTHAGVYMTPVLGDYAVLTREYGLTHGISWLMAGMVFFCFAFYLILAAGLSDNKRPRWLTVIAFFLFLRLMVRAETSTFVSDILGISYERQNICLFVIIGLLKIILIQAIHDLIPVTIPKKIVWGSTAFITASILFSLLVPRDFYNSGVYVIVPALANVVNLYALYKMIRLVNTDGTFKLGIPIAFNVLTLGYGIESLSLGGFFRLNYLWVAPLSYVVFIMMTIVAFTGDYERNNCEKLKTALLEKQLTAGRMALMLGQIKPHFLYNTLNTVDYLCQVDSEKARAAVMALSKYLRGNMTALSDETMSPFSIELEHAKSYVMIEQMRFGEKLRVEYDIRETDFRLPTLCLQPLVENAIKHGIQVKRDGGSVRISSYSDEKNWYAEIRDDGVGFAVNDNFLSAGEPHGLQNIKTRLCVLANATLSIRSRSGEGTTATITIPKGGADHACGDC